MPESIGSRKRVLPIGVVCDKCNNYFARKVEQPILTHSWMRNLRAWEQVPNKKGTYPSLVGHIAGTDVAVNMRRSRDGKLQLGTEKGSHVIALAEVMAQGFERPLIFTIEDATPKREMSRFLCKMAYETVAELFCSGLGGAGHLADEPFFDNVRKFARYGQNFGDWPFSQRRVLPHDTLMLHPTTNEWVLAGFGCGIFMNRRCETFFAFIFYGIEFVINVGGPSIAGYDEWLREHKGISPVVERLGCKLVTESDGKHYLHGSFEIKHGLEFDKAHGYGPFGGASDV